MFPALYVTKKGSSPNPKIQGNPSHHSSLKLLSPAPLYSTTRLARIQAVPCLPAPASQQRAMEAPIAGAMQRAVNSVQQGGTWKTGLFGCCDAGLCLKATCAPCLLAGENAERLEPGSYTSTCCKMSTCYMLTGSDAYVAWKQRQRLRERLHWTR